MKIMPLKIVSNTKLYYLKLYYSNTILRFLWFIVSFSFILIIVLFVVICLRWKYCFLLVISTSQKTKRVFIIWPMLFNHWIILFIFVLVQILYWMYLKITGSYLYDCRQFSRPFSHEWKIILLFHLIYPFCITMETPLILMR